MIRILNQNNYLPAHQNRNIIQLNLYRIGLLMGKKVFKKKNFKVKAQPYVKKEEVDDVKLEEKPQKQLKQEKVQVVDKKISKNKVVKKSRLIIRNLVFDINQKHIRKLMSPYGIIKQINIPKHPDKNGSKGFAFVELQKKNLCMKAIKDLNGMKYKGRTIVLDMAVSKDTYISQKMQDNKKQNEMKDEKDQNSEMDEQENEDEVKQEKQQSMEEQEDNDSELEQEDIKEEEEQDEDEDEKEEKVRADHESQIFIRNIPISITQADLFKHFKKYGKIYFVKVVMNKQTNTSKGTAFIKFHDPQIAQKLIEYSRGYEMFLQKKTQKFKPNPSVNLEMDGMIIKIFPVQTRNKIQEKLKQRNEGEQAPKKKKPIKKIKKLQDLIKTDFNDKRKLSLGQQGYWKADEQNMNKIDYEKFRTHEKQKIQKLKNPNNSVSSTRIILKFLQKSITEQRIKDLCEEFLEQRKMKLKSLTYCKLMMDSSMKKSAGFAFIQFQKHEISKQFIDMLVDKPQKLMNHPFVVEFAIQDSRKMLKLQKKNKKTQKQ